jgi:malate synthase
MAHGAVVDAEMVRKAIPGQLEKIRAMLGAARFDSGKFEVAAEIFERMMTSDEYPEFLTLAAYEYLD